MFVPPENRKKGLKTGKQFSLMTIVRLLFFDINKNIC